MAGIFFTRPAVPRQKLVLARTPLAANRGHAPTRTDLGKKQRWVKVIGDFKGDSGFQGSVQLGLGNPGTSINVTWPLCIGAAASLSSGRDKRQDHRHLQGEMGANPNP